MATTAAAPVDDDDPTAAVLAKVLAMAFLGASSFAAGNIPMCLFERMGIRRRARGAANVVLRLILNFGGGVLLCTTFLHLLPEVREGVGRLIDDGTLDPDATASGLLAEFIMCTGFFVMFSVEELVHGLAGAGDCHAHSGDEDHHHHHHHHHHNRQHQSQNHSSHNSHSGLESSGHGNHNNRDGHVQQRNDVGGGGGGVGQTNQCFEKDAAAGRVVNYNSCTSVVEIPAVKGPQTATSPAGGESVLRSFLVIGALSVHELFEGLAVGLEKNPAQVWSLTVAVACHKLVIAFYVGLQMLSDRTKPLLAHLSIMFFAVTSPLGIGVGTLISNLKETQSVVMFSVILQGLATGTLMYVVFFEVLKPSAGHLKIKHRILRLVFIAIGFSSMLSIQLILSE